MRTIIRLAVALSTVSAILIAAATVRLPPLVSAAAALAEFFVAAVATRVVTRAELKLLVGR